MGKSAVLQAITDTERSSGHKINVDALVVGNMMSGILSKQQHLGPLIATETGLQGVETFTVEACCGSGGGAMRVAAMMVASGVHKTVAVLGLERMTHADKKLVTEGYDFLVVSSLVCLFTQI